MLKFSKANSKTQALKLIPELQSFLGKRGRKTAKVYSMDLLSGHSCPFAEKCLSRAILLPNGKRVIKDGSKTEFTIENEDDMEWFGDKGMEENEEM